jgi:hypothetical protein
VNQGESHINVHAIMPGRPLVHNLKSKYPPSLGLSSTPIYMSYRRDPVRLESVRY